MDNNTINNIKYPILFHKYVLEIATPDTKINYEIKCVNNFNLKHIFHFHCYDISYLTTLHEKTFIKLKKQFSIIITFCVGTISNNDTGMTILKINDKGCDIGSKIIVYDYLNTHNIDYNTILFLNFNNKTDEHLILLNYWENRLELLCELIENYNIGGIFVNIINHKSHDTYEKYWTQMLDFLNCTNRDQLFSSNNMIMLNKKVLDFVFKDNCQLFYNILNTSNSFDLNWYWLNQNSSLNINNLKEIYQHYISHINCNNINIQNNNFTGAFEYTFNMIWLNVIKHISLDYLIIGENFFNALNIKINALYFPQFHEVPENNKFWEKEFTEWTLLKPYPEIKISDTNFEISIMKPHIDYDYYELNKTMLKKQITTANKYNINGFIIYQYWFSDSHKVMYKPLEYFLDDDIDFQFSICWANEPWTRTWDGDCTSDQIMLDQKYDNYDKHVQYLIPFFKKKNYMKSVENEVLYYIYNISHLTYDKFKHMKQIWENELNKCHIKIKFIFFDNNLKNEKQILDHDLNSFIFEPMHSDYSINEILSYDKFDENIYYTHADIAQHLKFDKEILYDHYKIYGYKEGRFKQKEFEGFKCSSINYDDIIKKYKNINCELLCNKILGLPLNWNNMVRRKNIPFLYVYNFNTSKLKEMLNMYVILIILRYKNNNFNKKYDNIIIVNAWNEWNEQAVLEPNHISGYENLETISKYLKSI
jgi:hypothetical protein